MVVQLQRFNPENAAIRSYADARNAFKRAKSPSKGRRLTPAYKLYSFGRNFIIYYEQYDNKEQLATIFPDSTITFNLPLHKLLVYSNSLVVTLMAAVPFMLQRKRQGIYSIASNWRVSNWCEIINRGTEYFTGIRFNLRSGECLNPRVDVVNNVVPEKRKEWLRDLRRYKQGLKSRAKIGALEGYVPQLVIEEGRARSTWNILRAHERMWGDEIFLGTLVKCMKQGKYPAEILLNIVGCSLNGWGPIKTSSAKIITTVDRLFDSHSIQLRRHYGVFRGRKL